MGQKNSKAPDYSGQQFNNVSSRSEYRQPQFNPFEQFLRDRPDVEGEPTQGAQAANRLALQQRQPGRYLQSMFNQSPNQAQNDMFGNPYGYQPPQQQPYQQQPQAPQQGGPTMGQLPAQQQRPVRPQDLPGFVPGTRNPSEYGGVRIDPSKQIKQQQGTGPQPLPQLGGT